MGASASTARRERHASLSSSIPENDEQEGEGTLPLNAELRPLHDLNLLITEHHHQEIGDLDLDHLSQGDILSLIKAYSAHHVVHDSEQSLAGGVERSKEELAHKARQLSRYFDRLANQLVHEHELTHKHKSSHSTSELHSAPPIHEQKRGTSFFGLALSSDSSSASPIECYAVSLSFLERFLAMNPKCATLSTADVVKLVIVPDSLEQKRSYVEAKLLNFPSSFLKIHERRNETTRVVHITHSWETPFSSLIEIARKVAFEHFPEVSPRSQIEVGDVGEKVFFHLDCFCENQHVRNTLSPEEIHDKMHFVDAIAVALWPVENPLVLHRTLCLFEMVTGLLQKKKLLPLCAKDGIDRLAMKNVVIDLDHSKEPDPRDAETLIEHLRGSIGVENANKLIHMELLRGIENESNHY